MLSKKLIVRHLSLLIIKHWLDNCIVNLRNIFQTMRLNILSVITIIINLKRMYKRICRWYIRFSYYDYYQPEAYVPSTDTFIEKDASINDEIDKLRHSATSAL